MFASAWRLIAETLEDLTKDGLEDDFVRAQLEKSASMRGKYLALFDVVNTLAGAYQARLAQLAMTSRNKPLSFTYDETLTSSFPQLTISNISSLLQIRKQTKCIFPFSGQL